MIRSRAGLSVFIDHYCLRCSRAFEPNETAVTVIARDGNYPVGLQVHFTCATGGIDKIVTEGKKVSANFVPRPRTWPEYVGEAKVNAYARICRLNNGVYRIGLMNSFPELWNMKMIMAHPIDVINGFDAEYIYFGPVNKNESLVHRVVETQFQDLTKPLEYDKISDEMRQII